ncbi:maltose alpha-D-glucosyltransferase/ alpha-amylase [Lachnospiraceae bacterium NK3A20]|nr:maltose alpha-D-glucosyltransferase/ alpha-amylase [Lachnospiraceae bacterium NK3A20]
MLAWLKDAVFYEIYPQSFKDTNLDGIGDFNGIIEKLDYIRDLGANALWINPCYDSPFKDAGYDVRDYKKVAPRYGENSDLYRLFGEAHNRGMHVLLDLVPGHTSEEHPWFLASSKAQKNEYSGRYVWTENAFGGMAGRPYIAGETPRSGAYMLNFFKCQPALNYGWLHPEKEWQDGVDSENAVATREAMTDVILFWLSHGCDGFRVDMADSLVKGDDENKSGTAALWRKVFEEVRPQYPEAAFVSEWSSPLQSIAGAGFDMDFLLDHPGKGYNSLLREYETDGFDHSHDDRQDHSFFKKDADSDITKFTTEYQRYYDGVKGKGRIALITCNHDTPRATRTLSIPELKLAWAFLLTMPGVPFIYYGDEIGMRYQDGMPTKEGGYARTGTRTPMQWTKGRNLGFSDGAPDTMYLPLDAAADAPTVEEEEKNPESLLHTVKDLTALRHGNEDLQADADYEVLFAERGALPFVYRRGRLIVCVNPSGQEQRADLPAAAGHDQALYTIGSAAMTADGQLTMGPQSFAVFA